MYVCLFVAIYYFFKQKGIEENWDMCLFIVSKVKLKREKRNIRRRGSSNHLQVDIGTDMRIQYLIFVIPILDNSFNF